MAAGCRAAWEEIELGGRQDVLGFGTRSDGEWLIARLKEVGVSVEWPVKKDADGIDTDEPEDRFDIGISIDESEKVGWWMECDSSFFNFNGNGFKSSQELLQYIHELRSSYYRAFSEHQFDIVFHSKMPKAQPLIAELNANPHL